MAPEDGLLIKYDRARRCAMLEKAKGQGFGKSPKEVAQAHGLSPAFTRILVSVITRWHGLGKSDGFVTEMDAIFHDMSVESAARALAAEHASSNFTGNERRQWGMAALLVTGLGDQDGQQIHDSVLFGEWDAADRTLHEEDIDDAMNRFIDRGAYNAPGRAMWWYDMLKFRFDAEPELQQKAYALLERVRARRVQGRDDAFNEYHLDSLLKRLDALDNDNEE